MLLLLSFLSVRELLTFYEFPGDTIPIIRYVNDGLHEIAQYLNLILFVYVCFDLCYSGSALAAATNGDAKLGKNAILQLMAAVEESIPTPKRELDKPFLLPVEDIFSIAGRGTVATGRVEQGKLKVGDEMELVGLQAAQKTTCTGRLA